MSKIAIVFNNNRVTMKKIFSFILLAFLLSLFACEPTPPPPAKKYAEVEIDHSYTKIPNELNSLEERQEIVFPKSDRKPPSKKTTMEAYEDKKKAFEGLAQRLGVGIAIKSFLSPAVLEYDKAIARITNLSVEVNGWGMRRFAVMGSKGTVEIKPIELNVEMTKSTTDIASNAYQDMKEKVDIKDVPTLSRYDEMMKDFYKSVIGEKENPYSYEHELAVQKTLCRVVGEN